MDEQQKKRGRPRVGEQVMAQKERHLRWIERLAAEGLVRKSVVIPHEFVGLLNQVLDILTSARTREIGSALLKVAVLETRNKTSLTAIVQRKKETVDSSD